MGSTSAAAVCSTSSSAPAVEKTAVTASGQKPFAGRSATRAVHDAPHHDGRGEAGEQAAFVCGREVNDGGAVRTVHREQGGSRAENHRPVPGSVGSPLRQRDSESCRSRNFRLGTSMRRTGWHGRGSNATSTRKLHKLLSAVLVQGMRWELVTRNVAVLASPPREVKPEISPPSMSDYAKIVRAADRHQPRSRRSFASPRSPGCDAASCAGCASTTSTRSPDPWR